MHEFPLQRHTTTNRYYFPTQVKKKYKPKNKIPLIRRTQPHYNKSPLGAEGLIATSD
jgi:hypothetical protein